MVERLSGPDRITAQALARETGIGQGTLSRWLRRATLGPMGKDQSTTAHPSSLRTWSWEKKLEIMVEASRLGEEELGAFLRERGLHEAQLVEWREQVQGALTPNRRKVSPEARRNQKLEKELRRKDKALAEVGALLALSKKVQELWGDGDESTHTN